MAYLQDVPVAKANPADIQDLLGGALFKALYKWMQESGPVYLLPTGTMQAIVCHFIIGKLKVTPSSVVVLLRRDATHSGMKSTLNAHGRNQGSKKPIITSVKNSKLIQ